MSRTARRCSPFVRFFSRQSGVVTASVFLGLVAVANRHQFVSPMTKANDVLTLAAHALRGNREMVLRTCRAMALNEAPQSSFRRKMDILLHSARPTMGELPKSLDGLLHAPPSTHDLDDVVLPLSVRLQALDFVREHENAGTLRDAGLSCSHKLLISGPPGNGKTTLAGAIANRLGRPLLVADFSALVSSHLGETGAKIAKIFRSIETPCVLFLDEMETLLSERSGFGNSTDVGEVRRVVATLLLEIDRLAEHIVLIGATNHPEMLDRAVVRRFDSHWCLPAPSHSAVEVWLEAFAESHPKIPVREAMKIDLDGCKSISDIEREAMRWCRKWVLDQHQPVLS